MESPPISVSEGMVTVVNQTDQDWKEVLITVNDHFRGFVPVLKAQGRANAPLSQFTTGHGQRWAMGTYVKTVDVSASDNVISAKIDFPPPEREARIVEREGALHASNVQLVCPECGKVRMETPPGTTPLPTIGMARKASGAAGPCGCGKQRHQP